MRTDFLGATFLGAIPQSVYPTSTGVLAGAGDPVYAARVDFDGHLRMGIADIGAYRVGTGPAWEIMEGFKASETPVVPGGDGGMSDAGSLDSGLGDAGPIDAGAGDAAVVDAGRSVDASVALPDAGARDGSWGAEDAGTPSSSSGGGCSCSTGGSRGIPMSAFAVLALSLGFSRRRSGPVA
jgi:MYXO-CTERM domain-containing protein